MKCHVDGCLCGGEIHDDRRDSTIRDLRKELASERERCERLMRAVKLATVELRVLGDTPLGAIGRLNAIVAAFSTPSREPAVPEPPK